VLSEPHHPAHSTPFFSRPRHLVGLATLCFLLWGSAYPAIKGGCALLGIARSDTAAQLAFAGWRFLLAGALLLAQTSLQHVFFYVGLDAGFSLLGEGFIVIAAFVLSAASICGKRVSQRIDPMVMTGWQLGIGGLVLLFGGLAGGGATSGWSAGSLALLGYMAVLSAVAFALWAALLKHNRVGQVTVFNFLIPVFGALLSALFLGEAVLEWRNLAALVMVCGGIWLVTTEAQAPRPAASST
jgi:uncharacterized membrane protein